MKKVSISVLIVILSIAVVAELSAKPSWHSSKRSGLSSDKISISGDTRPQPVYPTPEESQIVETSVGQMFDKSDEPSNRVLNLDDCIRLAVQRNKRLIAAGYEIDAARSQLTEAKALLWPVLEYKYRMAPVPKDVDDAFNKFFEG